MFGRYIWARAKGNSLSRVRAALVSAVILGALSFVVPRDARGQCGGMATSPASLADCAMRNLPIDKVAELDPAHVYSLAELIDIAESNNPKTHIVLASILTLLLLVVWQVPFAWVAAPN
jgi:hypothetical protein